MSNQVQNQPTAAYWLSLIGGILALLGSIVVIALGALAYLAVNSALSDFYSGGYSDYYPTNYNAFGLAGGIILAIGVWMMISSILVIVFARKLKADPLAHGKWGILILVFSLIGSWSILNFIGGILAIVYKPIPAGQAPYAPQQPQQPYYGPPPQQAYQPPQQAHNCPQCGTMVQPGVRFCPNCGKQQY